MRSAAASEPIGAASPVEYLYESAFVRVSDELRAYAAASFTEGRPVLDAACDLRRRIFDDFEYHPGATTIATPLREVMRARKGVCQDFAHLAIACLRAMGVPARYVSGYLVTEPAPGEEKRVGADASHAWLSVYCPGSGFVDLDPTNDSLPDESYVTTAWGRDFGDVSPIKGVILGGGAHTVHAAVDVTPIQDDQGDQEDQDDQEDQEDEDE